MAYNVAGLTTYVNENEKQIIGKSLFSPATVALIRQYGNVMVGVKSSQKINLLVTDAVFQSGNTCNPTPAGTTSITQRQVTVGHITIAEDICTKELNNFYASKALVAGSYQDKMPFEEQYVNLKIGAIAEALEIAVWQGDTVSGNVNLNKFDGLLKLIDAATPVLSNVVAFTGVPPITVATGITLANVKAIVNSTWLALPSKVQGKDDIRIFCGWDIFNKYINAFTEQNLFNFAPTGSEVSAANGVVIIPGTNYKLTAVHGLDGTNRLIAARMSNMFAATDLTNGEEQFKIMKDQFSNFLRYQTIFALGVNVAFPDEVVSFKLV